MTADLSQMFSTSLAVKRSWRDPGGRHFFETGEFILLAEKGFAIVENSIWELPPEDSTRIEQVGYHEDTRSFEFKVTAKMPRLVSVKWKEGETS